MRSHYGNIFADFWECRVNEVALSDQLKCRAKISELLGSIPICAIPTIGPASSVKETSLPAESYP